MKEDIKELIRYICDGDSIRAKKKAIQLLSDDTTKSDEHYRNSLLAKLKNEPTFMQLPSNISAFCIAEDVQENFNEKRYYLSEREKTLFDEIVCADKAASKLSELRCRYLNATLLYGESGTGKTTFGKYVAFRLGIPFLYLNFSFLIDSYLGGTSKNIQKAFEYAKTQRCVFMIDELDAIGIKRGDRENEVGEMSRIAIALMQCLDMLGNATIVISATNRYDIIDDAIKRRFTRYHEVKLLSLDENKALASRYLSDCGYETTKDEVLTIIADAAKQSEVENKVVEYIVKQIIGNIGNKANEED